MLLLILYVSWYTHEKVRMCGWIAKLVNYRLLFFWSLFGEFVLNLFGTWHFCDLFFFFSRIWVRNLTFMDVIIYFSWTKHNKLITWSRTISHNSPDTPNINWSISLWNREWVYQRNKFNQMKCKKEGKERNEWKEKSIWSHMLIVVMWSNGYKWAWGEFEVCFMTFMISIIQPFISIRLVGMWRVRKHWLAAHMWIKFYSNWVNNQQSF